MKIKIIIFAIITILITSCSLKLTSRVYTTIEPWKEWEIEMKLNKDSTFKMTDRFGCNIFDYSGRWRYYKDSIFKYLILNDTTKSEYIKSRNSYQFFNRRIQKLQIVRANQYFPVISTDTGLILSNSRIRFRGLTFERQELLSNKDLSKRRIKILESYYITEMGKDLFIKTFGKGKGIKEARKNLKECDVNSIPNSNIGKGN